MDGSLDLLCGIPGGDGGGRVGSGGSISIMRNDEQSNHSNHHMGCDDDGGGLELGLGLSIGSGLKTKEEGSCSSSSSSSSFVNIANSPIVGTNRAPVDSVSPPNATSLVGWPPITRANRNPIVAHRIKPEHDDFISRPVNNNRINGNGYLSVKVNMDGTLIGRKVNLNAHISYGTLSQTLENMFHGSRKQAKIANFGVSRILAQTMDPCNSSVGTISYMSRERINTGDIWLAKGHNLYIIIRTRTEKTKVPLTLGLLTDLFDGRLE